jgi:signal transduction histidine kinase
MLWTVLPLTLVLVGVAVIGINIHQRSMRSLVEELNARSARLAAKHLSDGLAERTLLLKMIAAAPDLPLDRGLEGVFDGGLARVQATRTIKETFPSLEAWQQRPLAELLFPYVSEKANQPDQPIFSPFFVDPISGSESLLIALVRDDEIVVGSVSLEQLGLADIAPGPAEVTASADGAHSAGDETTVFLVAGDGQVIYHPDPRQIGQDLKAHEGVAAAIQGQSGATYHQEPDGQELVVGYAPVDGPNWGLIVQEPWEKLLAPATRLSLLTPLVVVIAALVSGLAVTFGLRYVVRPLQALDRQATRLAWGDFSEVSELVEGVKEIKDLQHTLTGMAEQIQRYQAGMRDYVATVTTAQEAERKRLARDLHDETVQSLIVLGHRVEMAQKTLEKDPQRARQRLAELRALTDEAQQEVRRFSRALRPLYLEDLGFVPALEMLAQETEREHSLPVSLSVEGEVRRLAPDLELTAYRIVQEGLSNVIRHAEAQAAWLTVSFEEAALTLRVRDDGRGFEPPLNPADLAHQGHFGLMGIRERAMLFRGRLEVRSETGKGTELWVILPVAL